MTGPAANIASLSVFDRLIEALGLANPRPLRGRVRKVAGNLVYASAGKARVGDACFICDRHRNVRVPAEIIGFEGETALLSPLGDVAGFSTECDVVLAESAPEIPVGHALLGRAIDCLGRPLDGEGEDALRNAPRRALDAGAPSALARRPISRPLPFGIRAIDGLLTCAEGQRIGIYGEPGAGKSQLMAQILRNAASDVNVIALIGERGREVEELFKRRLPEAYRKRSVFVVATSDRAPIERAKAAQTAMTVAEAFRDEGAKVLLAVDSVTRYARALREIGLAAGEPPARRGFPPSVFAALPALFERSGNSERGSITGVFTVLVEGDGYADPIAEETQSLLDGHIVLSRKLSQANHFPAIDINASLSRVMPDVVEKDHLTAARKISRLLAKFNEIEFLLQVGEYKPGSDALADEAIGKKPVIDAFLQQATLEKAPFAQTLSTLGEIAG